MSPSTQAFVAVMRKEILEALREKQLRLILIVGLVFPAFMALMQVEGVKSSVARAEKRLEELEQQEGAGPIVRQEREAVAGYYDHDGRLMVPAGAVWIGVGYGMLLATLFAVTLALEAFVGEKERKTIEVLFATPLTDRQLFVVKILSCVVISVSLATAFMLFGIVLTALLALAYGLALPWATVGVVIAYGVTLALTLSVTFATVGCLISSKVSSVKAGGQVLGLVLLAPIVILMGLPLLLKGHFDAVAYGFEVMSHVPNWVIICELLLFFGLVNWLLLSLGAVTFSRERILTEA
jgi:ABC-type Na+ efflux pump permease subunit